MISLTPAQLFLPSMPKDLPIAVEPASLPETEHGFGTPEVVFRTEKAGRRYV